MAKQPDRHSAQTLEDLLSNDQNQNVYERLRHRYISNLLETTPYKTRTAFIICENTENMTPLEYGLYGVFPSALKTYTAKYDAYRKAKKPIDAQRKELDKKKKELQISLEEAANTRKKPIEAEIDSIRDQLIDLDSAARALKEPRYRKRYDSDRDIFSSEVHKIPKKHKDYVLEKDWEILKKHHKQQAEKPGDTPEEAIFGNIALLSDSMGLSPHQVDLLKFLIVHENSENLGMFVKNLLGHSPTEPLCHAVISRMTEVPVEVVKNSLSEESPLVQYGMLYVEEDKPGVPVVSPFIDGLLFDPSVKAEDIKSKLSGEPVKTDLDWHADFGGMGVYGSDIRKLINHSYTKKAAGEKHPGPVIWFTGEPDTGKTSAAIALIQDLQKTHPDLEIRRIGESPDFETDEDTGRAGLKKMGPQERLSQIMLSVSMAGNNPNLVFLIEEPESFMPKAHDEESAEEGPVERVIIQRLMEQNPAVAIIFTTNHAEEIHPAVRRRGIELEFDIPGRDKRKRIIERVLEKHDMTLPDQQIEQLARTYMVPAGKWASSIPMAKITADGPEEYFTKICQWIERQAERDHGNVSKIMPAHVYKGDYDLSLVNQHGAKPGADIDNFLTGIENTTKKGKRFEILLEGWPGTGKTELGWMIADKIDQEVLYIQRSDILNMYVGGSEQNLAKIFKDALAQDKMILIDEVETMVPQRSGGNAKHENSLVAEFLSQMDRFKEKGGRIIVTTNHADQIDSAVNARFTRRLTFDFLKPEQNILAWNKFFPTPLPSELEPRLKQMNRLAPRDFALVLEQAESTDMIEKPGLLLDALDQRQKDKPKEQQPRKRKGGGMGFVRSGDLPVVANSNIADQNGHKKIHDPITITKDTCATLVDEAASQLGNWRGKKPVVGKNLTM